MATPSSSNTASLTASPSNTTAAPTITTSSSIMATASSSSSSTVSSSATHGAANASSPTATSSATPSPTTVSPEPSNWAELVLKYADQQVQSKDHPDYPNSDYEDLLTHGNNPHTRLLVISSNPQEDEKLVESIKSDKSERANKVHYMVLPLSNFVKKSKFMKNEFITEVKDKHRPTMFVFKSKKSYFKEVREALGNDGHILNFWEKSKGQLTEAKDGNVFFEAKNILPKEEEPAVQGFSVVADGDGVRNKVREVLRNNRNIENGPGTKPILISGTHGGKRKNSKGNISAFAGESGLSSEDNLNQDFYAEDCATIGFIPYPSQFYAYLGGDFLKWKSPAAFTRPSILTPTPRIPLQPKSSSPALLNDPLLNKMAFQVVDLAWYHNRSDLRGNSAAAIAKRTQEFVKDIKAFNPTMIMLAYCFSSNGDLALALRSVGQFEAMIVEYDLRHITRNPLAVLDKTQKEVLEQMSSVDIEHVVLCGSSGVGKTLLGAAKVKSRAALEKMNDPEAEVEIWIVHMDPLSGVSPELLTVMEDKYFLGLEAYNIEFVHGEKMCEKLGVSSDGMVWYGDGMVWTDPIGTIKEICEAKNKENEEKEKKDGGKTVSIFMFDEVVTRHLGGRKVFDCKGLGEVAGLHCVRTVTCLAPRSTYSSSDANFEVKMPTSDPSNKIYAKHLTLCYRNAIGIRLFNTFMADHFQTGPGACGSVMSREHDSSGQYLPPGPAGKHAVTWLEVEKEGDMGKAAKQAVQQCGDDEVVVLFNGSNDFAKQGAKESGVSDNKIFSDFGFSGCEARTIIYIAGGTIRAEGTSRAMERLIIVTGIELSEGYRCVLNLGKEKQHVHIKSGNFECSENPCPWSDKDKAQFPLLEHKVYSPPPPDKKCVIL